MVAAQLSTHAAQKAVSVWPSNSGYILLAASSVPTELRTGWYAVNLQRLKTRSQFQAVLAGRTVARTSHFVLHCCDLPQPELMPNFPGTALFPHQAVWIGAMVPRRWAKRAVTRSTIKRQIYNVSTEYGRSLTERAHVVRLRCAFNNEEYKSATSTILRCAVRTELHQLFGSQLELMPSALSNLPTLHHTP